MPQVVPRAVLIEHDTKWEIITPYDPAFIDALKWGYSWGASWNPSAKHWTIQSYRVREDDLQMMLDEYFDVHYSRCYMSSCCPVGYADMKNNKGRPAWNVAGATGGSTRTQAPPSELEKACATLGVTMLCSERVAKAAYRACALDAHPDSGGSTEKMQKVNAAWEQVKRARGFS